MRPYICELERLLLSYLSARFGREDHRPWTDLTTAAHWRATYIRMNLIRKRPTLDQMLDRFVRLKWIEKDGSNFRLTLKGAERYSYAKAFEN